MTSNPASVGPAPDGEGWIEWSGGENPVPGRMVEVRFRNGDWTDTAAADLLWGRHENDDDDIIAYRIASHPDREAEPAGGVVEAVARLIEPNAWMAKDVNPDWQVIALTRKIIAPKAVEQSLKKAAEILSALSVSPPVVEGSSAKGADTQPDSADDWADLEALAKRCTGGDPWYSADDLRGKILGVEMFIPQDRAFIAAANPATILKLIEAARHQPTTPGEQGEGGA